MSLFILCYHKVGPVAEEGRWLNVEVATLDSHIAFFKRRGFPFLRAADLIEQIPERAVVLTFDDAYRSAMSGGLEAMQARGVLGTFYAVPGCVGGSSKWDADRARPLADWEDLRRVFSLGFEIGNHTSDHPNLSTLPHEGQVRVWTEARTRFEAEGLVTTTACYPYGLLGPTSEQAVSQAGYRLAVGLAKRPYRAGDSLLRLPRIVVAYSDRVPKLLYKLYVRPKLP